jgi:hypothetical protein
MAGRMMEKAQRTLGWRGTVIVLTLAAVIVRLVIVAHSRGGEDLRMYVYFSRLPLHGINPFSPPPGGMFPAVDSNNPPVEVTVFTGLLKLHDSPTMLRVLFVLADAAVLLVIGLAYQRPRRWRLAMMLFYGFNPFILVAFTAFAEDKTLLFLGIACWLLALERDSELGSWLAAAALTAFKFLGAFAAPALALRSWRRDGIRAMIPIGAYGAVFLLSNAPWFPASLHAFSRRNVRLGIDPPIHASPWLLVSRAGLYAPAEAKIALVVSLIALLVLYAIGRIEIREAVVFSLFAGYAFLPDDAFNRLILITLPLLLLLDLSVWRWVAVWVVTCWGALAAVVAVRGVPHELARIAGPLHAVFSAHEATVRHVLWVNLFPALVLAFYFYDRSRGRAPVGVAPDRLPVARARARRTPVPPSPS